MSTTELHLDDPEVVALLESETVDVVLEVPTSPTVLDLALAYRKKVQREYETSEEAVFDRELELANAERIAMAARSRVTALKIQLDALDLQIKHLQP